MVRWYWRVAAVLCLACVVCLILCVLLRVVGCELCVVFGAWWSLCIASSLFHVRVLSFWRLFRGACCVVWFVCWFVFVV